MDVDFQPNTLHIEDWSSARFTHPKLTTLPNDFNDDEREAFTSSLQDDPIEAARLWEDVLLPDHPDLPFLLLRVADVRATLGSVATAFSAYLKVQAALGVGEDPVFDAFVDEYRAVAETTRESEKAKYEQVATLEDAHQMYTTAKDQPRPSTVAMIYLNFIRESVANAWGPHGMTDVLWNRYLNAFCIEIGHLDEAFQLTPQSARKLARDGLSPIMVDYTSTSRVKDKVHIISIIEDTRKAWEFTQEISRDYRNMLTVENIKHLHKMVMRSSRFLPNLGDHQMTRTDPKTWKYVNLGETRTCTQGTILNKRDDITVAACPFDEVDQELAYLCKLTEQWIRTYSMRHPVSITAWLLLVFSRIQPFEEGNVRVASLIATLPMTQMKLPPLVIPPSLRKEFSACLAKSWEGNMFPMAECIVKSIRMAVEEVSNM